MKHHPSCDPDQDEHFVVRCDQCGAVEDAEDLRDRLESLEGVLEDVLDDVTNGVMSAPERCAAAESALKRVLRDKDGDDDG